MEDSLRSWLHSAFDEIIADDDSSCDRTESHMLLTVGRYIFSLPEDSSFETVQEEMSAHFGRDISPFAQQSSIFAVEACLICAVSSLSADRTRFVQVIMRMEPTAQAHIMEALKNNLQHTFDHVGHDAVDEESTSLDGNIACDPGSIIAVEEVSDLPSLDSEGNLQTDAPMIPISEGGSRGDSSVNSNLDSCVTCADSESKRRVLTKDLESVIRREKDNEAKLRAEITVQTNKLIDAEIIIIQKDDELSEARNQLEAALATIHENEIKAKENMKVVNEIQTLHDEIDVLKPKADRADAAEQQVDKLRSRLDELKGKSPQKGFNLMWVSLYAAYL